MYAGFYGRTVDKRVAPDANRKSGGDQWLYGVYRCGFVHAFYPSAGSWGRSKSVRYWTRSNPPILNIDRLVRGFMDGVGVFRERCLADAELRTNFKSYITKS